MEEIILPGFVLSLMERLEQAGEEVFVVGGSLRDALLGRPAHDFDLATSARPERTAELFSDHRVITTGLKHGTVTVLSEENPVEITTFRIDGGYTDTRHPDAVTFTDRITDDLARRDFTVNAMAYHPRHGLVDPFGGRSDLRAGLLRAVREPVLRFSEDALRIMRAFRFSAQLSFAIEENTLLGAAACRDGLARIAKERIASELLRLLCSDGVTLALTAMMDTGVLPYVTGTYTPSPRILESLPSLPPDEIGRLGHFLSETTTEEIKTHLHALKCSKKQLTGACAVARGSSQQVKSPADARRLITSCGVWASLAVRSSVARGISPSNAIDFVEKNQAPCSISQLAVNGKDLIGEGISGKAVGDTLQYLLETALENPQLNHRDSLLALARQYAEGHILPTRASMQERNKDR